MRKFCFVKKFSKFQKNYLAPDPYFPARIRIKIKWIISTGLINLTSHIFQEVVFFYFSIWYQTT